MHASAEQLFPERILFAADEREAMYCAAINSARWFSPLFVDRDTADEGRDHIAARAERWATHRHAEHAIADAIERAAAALGRGFDVYRLVKKLRLCRRRGAFALVGEDYRVLWDFNCSRAKLCADAALAEQKRVLDADLPALTEWLSRSPRRRLFYAVFTDHNFRPGQLLAGKRWLIERFKAWRKKMPRVRAARIIEEDPLSADGEWNVHLNALLGVEGEFSYEEARAAWGANVEFRQITGDAEEIAGAYAELVKYAAQVLPTKSAEHAERHATAAPAMIDWPAARLLEWLTANGLTVFSHRFKRSRAYGALQCPEATIWQERPAIELILLCEAVGVSTRAPGTPWRRLDTVFGAGTRAALLRLLRPSQPSLRDTPPLYLGSIVFDGTRYRVDLIPGDNSPAENGPPTLADRQADHWPTGPPLH